MTTSELRRGPGWWMDLDGSWKPPQDWPEASPPLPGWTRDTQGTWGPTAIGVELEAQVAAGVTTIADDPIVDPVRPIPDLSNITYSMEAPNSRTLVEPIIDARLAATPLRPASLTFSEAEFEAPPKLHKQRTIQRALMAAVVAAVTSSMLAAGLIVLLLVL
ncbi:MAG: hypothetical protein ACI81L_003515 [Verrucomicrobiales bacterium]|jgi:hypothetical protein